MPIPRISGNLYNCSLNCALPHILDTIQLIVENSYDGHHQAAYELLKTKFENWYGVSVTWLEFHQLLSSLSFNEIELVLAPILRLFIAEKCEPGEILNLRDIVELPEQGIDPAVITALRDANLAIPLNTPGRYLPLDNQASNRLFYHHFGLQMQVHEFTEGTYDDYQIIENARDDITSIPVFLKLGHFELQKHREVIPHQYQDAQIQLINERISSNQSAFETNRALADLIPIISNKIAENKKNKHQLITPAQYIENVHRFNLHHASIEGKLTYAVILLTLMENFTETMQFANHKLKQSYSLRNISSIEKLLADTIGVANGGPIPSVSDELVFAPKSITKEEFNKILNSYQSSYWMLNLIKQLCSFGWWKHESHTMQALRTLEKNECITQSMVEAALSQNTGDSQHARRLSFWQSANKEQFHKNCGTDQVLDKLQQAFIR